MNQVNITGMIANEPIFREEAGSIPHTVLNLRHRHTTRAGEVRKETYRVSAWHGVAQWARDNIAAGQIVTIHGYLTQRKTLDGATATEICALEIVPSVQTSFKTGQIADGAAIAASGVGDKVRASDTAGINAGADICERFQDHLDPSAAADIAPVADAACDGKDVPAVIDAPADTRDSVSDANPTPEA